jgi:tripeptide aminopeptidase
MSPVVERFLRYVKIDTQSSETSGTHPSTQKQKNLAHLLFTELRKMGIQDVTFDEECGYVYAHLPASDGYTGREGTLLFMSHMDTAPSASGTDVKPVIHENYDGGVLTLNGGTVLNPEQFTSLKKYVGQTIITSDGTTLLGADDKAGVAEIMQMVEELVKHPEKVHRPLSICFTPDEEIGEGTECISLEKLAADFGYTVDGDELGSLEYENFNAASAEVTVHGRLVHPGSAKGIMVNACRIAFEFEQLLPAYQKPEFTDGYEGFFYLDQISGDTEEAHLSYIIRDHDRNLFEQKKALMQSVAAFLNQKYGDGTFEVECKNQYFNMKEKLENAMFLVDDAKEAFRKAGVEPNVQPIRGGTDGAMLSYMGIPCPNLSTGGQNFHGRYEFVVAESMEKMVEVLLTLSE